MGVTAAIIGGVALAGAGAGIGLAGASSAKRGAQLRDLSDEWNQIPFGYLQDQASGLVEEQFGNAQRFSDMVLGAYPQYARETRQAGVRTANQVGQISDRFAALERGQTSAQRAGDVGDLGTLGPGLSTALSRSSPGYAALIGQLGAAGTRSPLASALETDATRELGLGRGLSPEEERAAVQSARGAWSARGLAFSNPAVGSEILARDQFATQRAGERRNYALGVEGLLGQEDQAARSFTLAGSQATTAPLMGLIGSRAGNAFAPALGAFGVTPQIGQTAGVMSAAPSIFQGVSALTPGLSYAEDLYNTDFNARESRFIRGANAQSAIGGGLMSAGGSIAGAGIGTMK